MMSLRTEDKPNGQTLVLVALLMVVLLGFVALAIDVGNIYSVRRHMQNAADAGALAGAREICFGNPALWEVKAREYAISRNGASEASTFERPTYWRVKVTAWTTATTYLAGIAGLDRVNVPAVAVAACGEATEACGLWPVAFDLNLWDYMTKEEESGARLCGKLMYIWDDDAPNAEPPNCDICDCDIDDVPDGLPDIADITGRAWVDFSSVVQPPDIYPDECYDTSAGSVGCGTNELKCWIEHNVGARVPLNVCVNGDTGVKAGAKNEVEKRAKSDDPVVSIPLFDGTGCPPHEGAKPCGSGETFWVTDFGCVRALGWEQNLRIDCDDGSFWQGKAIKVSVECGGCVTYCGSTNGEEPDPAGVRAVSLIQ